MAFINKDGLQHLTNQLVKAENIKVASIRGSNIKEIIDNIQRECDNVAQPNTMQIENNVSIFKAGQGNNVNVSEDIEAGMSNFSFKGITYQNLVKEMNSSNTVWNRIDKECWELTSNGVSFIDFECLLKANITYTILFNLCSKDDGVKIGFRVDNETWSSNAKNCYYQGLNIITQVSSKDANRLTIHRIDTSKTSSVKISNIVVLEGDYSNISTNELPNYFNGIKNAFEEKVINVKIQGKNLFNINGKCSESFPSSIGAQPNDIQGNVLIANSNTDWSTGSGYVINNAKGKRYRIIAKNLNFGTGKGSAITINYKNECNIVVIYNNNLQNKYNIDFYSKEDEFLIGFVTAGGTGAKFTDIQIEEATRETEYEPFFMTNTKIDIKEPLRCLPNGICDEIKIENEKWKLIRRIGSYTFTGNEIWQYEPDSNMSKAYCYYYDFGKVVKTVSNDKSAYICNNMRPINYAYNNNTYIGKNVGSNSDHTFNIAIGKTEFGTNKTQSQVQVEFSNWLKNNPTTVYYQLNEPIIEEITPIECYVSEGAMITLNSKIAPYSTHTVVLNRSGQIEQGIELIAKLRNKIDNLEREYDNNLLNTQLQINNLKLNLKLKGDK